MEDDGGALFDLLATSPDSHFLEALLAKLYRDSMSQQTTSSSPTPLPPPQISSYPDKTVYHSYPSLAISLEFRHTHTDRSDSLILVGIDIENHLRNEDELVKLPSTSRSNFSRNHVLKPLVPFPSYPILLPGGRAAANDDDPNRRAAEFRLYPTTTAKELVQGLGEPTRKGGSDIPSASAGIWLEWTWPSSDSSGPNREATAAPKKRQVGVFVQWRGEASAGVGKWEKGKDRMWGSIKVFCDLE